MIIFVLGMRLIADVVLPSYETPGRGYCGPTLAVLRQGVRCRPALLAGPPLVITGGRACRRSSRPMILSSGSPGRHRRDWAMRGNLGRLSRPRRHPNSRLGRGEAHGVGELPGSPSPCAESPAPRANRLLTIVVREFARDARQRLVALGLRTQASAVANGPPAKPPGRVLAHVLPDNRTNFRRASSSSLRS